MPAAPQHREPEEEEKPTPSRWMKIQEACKILGVSVPNVQSGFVTLPYRISLGVRGFANCCGAVEVNFDMFSSMEGGLKKMAATCILLTNQHVINYRRYGAVILTSIKSQEDKITKDGKLKMEDFGFERVNKFYNPKTGRSVSVWLFSKEAINFSTNSLLKPKPIRRKVNDLTSRTRKTVKARASKAKPKAKAITRKSYP